LNSKSSNHNQFRLPANLHATVNSDEQTLKFIKFKIEIADTGCGIKKENLGKLFMDFGKLDEHSKINAQGTGLGLSICKRMIEKMGGTVTVESQEDVGTTFTVSLVMRAKVINYRDYISEGSQHS
jgi:signal transduction histidine kinase